MKVAPRRTTTTALIIVLIFVLSGSISVGCRRAARAVELTTSGHTRSQHTWVDHITVPYTSNTSNTLEEREDVLFDGLRRFARIDHRAHPELIFLVLTKDKSSWGYETFQPSRTFHDFLSLMNSTQLDLHRVSLGIMTSSEEEYYVYCNATAHIPLPRVTILLKRSEQDRDGNLYTSLPRGGRHSHAIQTARRSNLAAFRNELMSRAIHDERHIIWVDSDIRYLSPRLVQTMLHHSETREDAGIITARCQAGWNTDYDANSWAGRRSKGPSSGRSGDSGDADEEEVGMTQKHVEELIHGTTDDDIVGLDSVGGTILYVRASLVHQGLTFPPYYVIGTRWGRDGWDGLETEGICYIARYLGGGGCYVLGGRHEVQHTSH